MRPASCCNLENKELIEYSELQPQAASALDQRETEHAGRPENVDYERLARTAQPSACGLRIRPEAAGAGSPLRRGDCEDLRQGHRAVDRHPGLQDQGDMSCKGCRPGRCPEKEDHRPGRGCRIWWPPPSAAAGCRSAPDGVRPPSSLSGPPAWARPSWSRCWPPSCSTPLDPLIRLDMSEFMEKHAVSTHHRLALRAMWAMTRPDSSPKRCAASPIRWCCSTRSKRPIPMCSTSCCRSWTRAGSPMPTGGRCPLKTPSL